jgi:uncharacterized protein DUF6463
VANVVAWVLFALGVGHIAYGLVKFNVPLSEAFAAGFVGQFMAPEVRRTAFWFLVVGPLLMLAGHAAVHAVATADLALLKLIGFYVLAISILGVSAFPLTPFLATLIVSPLLIAAGYGLLP